MTDMYIVRNQKQLCTKLLCRFLFKIYANSHSCTFLYLYKNLFLKCVHIYFKQEKLNETINDATPYNVYR